MKRNKITIKPVYATIRADEIVRLDTCPRCGKVRQCTRDTNEGAILMQGVITCTIGDTEVIRVEPKIGQLIICDRCEDYVIALGRHLTVKSL